MKKFLTVIILLITANAFAEWDYNKEAQNIQTYLDIHGYLNYTSANVLKMRTNIIKLPQKWDNIDLLDFVTTIVAISAVMKQHGAPLDYIYQISFGVSNKYIRTTVGNCYRLQERVNASRNASDAVKTKTIKDLLDEFAIRED